MKKLFITIVGLCIVLTSCKTSTRFVPFQVIPITERTESIHSTGKFYALPRQSVGVDIVVRKQEFIRGPYAQFAERLLGVTNFIREDYSVFSIENVSISQRIEADPNQIFFVQFNDSELALEYYDGLIISSVNVPSLDLAEAKRRNLERRIVWASQTADFPIAPTFNLTEQQQDTVFFQQLVDTEIVQRFEVRTIQTVRTPLQRAQEIVANIAQIREDRNRLLTGFHEVNYEYAAIRYMNEEFNRMEDEYIRLFTGTVRVSYETVRFELMPTNRNNLTFELTGFSEDYGFASIGTDLGHDFQAIRLNILLQDDIISNIQRFSQNIQLRQTGFHYRIPSQALVTVKLGNQLLHSQQMPFSQFGITQSLAPDLLQIDFSPQTGEIRSIRTID
ncbi:MAG: DUF4831 family protein [Bacteroidales bacterium]|nr:DUF4831 family protein [Bacteroidales bacterium]